MNRLRIPALVLAAGFTVAASPLDSPILLDRGHAADGADVARWGADGHEMAATAAARGLPSGVPEFFRDASDQLAYLNPEPDRWRNRDMSEMDQAFSYDHYIDFENVPDGALDAPDRYEFLAALYRAELPKPERDVGMLPFHIMELYQRLVTEWSLWAAATGTERDWIEARIINDAGILGHYVTDGSQPHHTSIHFNGWNASGVRQEPNPEGFTESRDFHGRFESGFVRRHVNGERVSAAASAPPRRLSDARPAVFEYLGQTHDQLRTLYRLENEFGFVEDGTPAQETVDFAIERLAAGAEMLRDLWWSAWLDGTGQ